MNEIIKKLRKDLEALRSEVKEMEKSMLKKEIADLTGTSIVDDLNYLG